MEALSRQEPETELPSKGQLPSGCWGLYGHRGLLDFLALAAHKLVLAGSQVLLGGALHLLQAPSSIEDLEKGPNLLNPHYARNLSLKEAHGVITPMALSG